MLKLNYFVCALVVNTYPNSGTAIKCKGLNLPILQEHLQHIWYE